MRTVKTAFSLRKSAFVNIFALRKLVVFDLEVNLKAKAITAVIYKFYAALYWFHCNYPSECCHNDRAWLRMSNTDKRCYMCSKQRFKTSPSFRSIIMPRDLP